MGRFILMVVAIQVAFTLPVGCGTKVSSKLTPARAFRGSIDIVRPVLAPHRTEREMNDFVGAYPAHCAEVPREAKICVWRLSKRESGWWPLAEALDTANRLNLVCEFPADDASRLEDSCSVHSQRSNRDQYWNRSLKYIDRKNMESAAVFLFLGTRTAFELSTLVGDAPSMCQTTGARVSCTWNTDAATYGHGTLALYSGEKMSERIRMSCALPSDGSIREPDSCIVHAAGDRVAEATRQKLRVEQDAARSRSQQENDAEQAGLKILRASAVRDACRRGMRDDQLEFLEALGKFAIRYDHDTNEIRKSRIFNEALEFDGKFFESRGHGILYWTGKLIRIRTVKGGKEASATVAMVLPDQDGDTLVKKVLVQESAGIQPGSLTYNSLGEMDEGDAVVFSARFGARKASATEAETVNMPEYEVEFTDISSCADIGKSAAD